MSTPQGIEPPAPEPPYAPGDLIFDRTQLDGPDHPAPAFKVIECVALPPLLREAARGASWHVLYELPANHAGSMFVDDRGFTQATVYGPHPYTAAEVGEQLRAARAGYRNAFLDDDR